MRDMGARFTALGRESESRVGKARFTKMWGTKRTKHELALLRLQHRAIVAAPQTKATEHINEPNGSEHDDAKRICAGVVDDIVSAAASTGGDADLRKQN